MAHCTTSAQNSFGIFLLFIMDRTISRIVQFFISATPFCCGEYEAVKNIHMSCSSQYFMNSVHVNSPPLSDRTVLMCLSVSFSTITLNFLNTSDFSFKKYTHVFREKSSTKEIKYLLPLKDSGVIGPHTSVWIRPSCSFAWYLEFLGNEVLDCLPSIHSSHNLLLNSMLGNPCTIPFFTSSISPAKCKWPNRKCHIIVSHPGHQVSNTSLVWSLIPTYTFVFSSSLHEQSNVQVCPASLVLVLSLKSSNPFTSTVPCSKCYFWDQVHSTRLKFP